MSALTNVDEASLSNFERGTRRIGLTSLVLVADSLHVGLDYLLYGSVGYKLDLDRDQQLVLEMIDDCTPIERAALVQILASAKEALERCKEDALKQAC